MRPIASNTALETAARLELATRLAGEVRTLTLAGFQSPRLKIARKPDGSVVTDYDKRSEELIRAAVTREFPQDAILGEEFGETPGTSGFRWILDPIDGTGSFVRGIPHFVSLIGIEHDDEMAAGVIEVPALGERLTAVRGDPKGPIWTLRNGESRRARVSATVRLDDALIEIGPYGAFHRNGMAEVYQRLCAKAKRNRGWSDGYAFLLLATGRVDAAIHFGFKPWDLAAPMVCIEEAGGRLTDWSGQRTINAERPLATNGALHEAFLEQLR